MGKIVSKREWPHIAGGIVTADLQQEILVPELLDIPALLRSHAAVTSFISHAKNMFGQALCLSSTISQVVIAACRSFVTDNRLQAADEDHLL